jgi:APA family basic amino acid/polyamine antiporter
VSGPGLIAVAIGSIVVLLLVNLRGARSAGALQIGTVLIKLIPLLAVLALVLARFGTGQHVESLAPVPLTLSGVTAAAALILFSLTGFECAAVAANVTRDSTETVPRATIVGTGFTAIVYLLTTVATLMLLPSAVAAKSGAPFADAIAPLLGDAAGILVALIAAISAFGTANSLLLVAAESSRTMASAGDLPSIFARANRVGAPAGALWICSAAAALLVLASSSKNFVSVYVFITLVSTVLALVLYLVRGGGTEASGRRQMDRNRRDRHHLLDRDVRRRRTEHSCVGRSARNRWRSRPPYLALAKRLQPGGGGESSRASGMNRRSFCAKLLRQTSLVPSGPAL